MFQSLSKESLFILLSSLFYCLYFIHPWHNHSDQNMDLETTLLTNPQASLEFCVFLLTPFSLPMQDPTLHLAVLSPRALFPRAILQPSLSATTLTCFKSPGQISCGNVCMWVCLMLSHV